MTIKEASRQFSIEEKDVRKRYKDGMIIGARKDGRYIFVPDDTEIMPSKQEIKSFLFQIIKHKTNGSYVISRGLCPDLHSLKVLLRYLYKKGLIGFYQEEDSEMKMLSQIQLTDEGFAFVFGEKTCLALNNGISVPLTINLGSVVV